MQWLTDAHTLSQHRTPFVVVTVLSVRGHAPRGAGSKMLVSAGELLGSIGGGNIEHSAVLKARALLASEAKGPVILHHRLNPYEGDHGKQCCGGEVAVLLEPCYPQQPHIAIFGAGHVSQALTTVLSTLPVTVTVIDSREAFIRDRTPTPHITYHHAPVPEAKLADLPPKSVLLIMTHDHAEDIAVLERALSFPAWCYVGLIGSRAKWAHFQQELKQQGYGDADLARVTTPIGLPEIEGKTPAVIAVSVVAQLLQVLQLPDT